MIDFLLQLIKPRALFNLRPSPIDVSTFKILIGFFVLFVALSIVFIFLARRFSQDYLLKRSYNNFFSLFLTIGLLGLLYSWLVYESVPVLSARFIFLILIIIFLVWLGFALRYHIVKIPKIKKSREEKKQFEQYLP